MSTSTNTQTQAPANEPIIVMTRLYDAPRTLVWEAMTEPRHVRAWWGGPGFTNPVCEMDVPRPGSAPAEPLLLAAAAGRT